MPKSIPRPSPATLISALALFVALGGTGYAAILLPKNSVGAKQIRTSGVTSKDIRRGAVRSLDVRNNTLVGRDVRARSLGGREILESTLATVPHAVAADTLGGLSAAQLKVSCPPTTDPASATCMETSHRSAQSFGQANATCFLAGRRLPTYPELVGYFNLQRPVGPGGEWTASVGESSTTPGQLVATVVLTNTGSSVEFIDATGAAQRSFRCAASPAN
jgi:hypothetical protein